MRYSIEREGGGVKKADLFRKRWFIFLMAAVLTVLAILAVSYLFIQVNRANAKSMTPSQITTRIIREMNRSDLAEVSPSQLTKHYTLPSGVVAESSLYMSRSSESAAELACFRLTDKSKFPELQAEITDHLNAKAVGFKDLNPTQYNALKSASVVQNEKYVLVSVGSNPAADAKLFNEILKE